MDRITSRTLSGQAIVPIPKPKGNYAGPWPNPYEPAVERLAAIEDILGDTYDLDHLREMITDYRECRIFITPLNPGDTVYWLLDDDGYYVSSGETIADVGTKGFYTNGVTDLIDICATPDFTPWDELGKNVFRSREEAEVALAKMKEDEHG